MSEYQGDFGRGHSVGTVFPTLVLDLILVREEECEEKEEDIPRREDEEKDDNVTMREVQAPAAHRIVQVGNGNHNPNGNLKQVGSVREILMQCV